MRVPWLMLAAAMFVAAVWFVVVDEANPEPGPYDNRTRIDPSSLHIAAPVDYPLQEARLLLAIQDMPSAACASEGPLIPDADRVEMEGLPGLFDHVVAACIEKHDWLAGLALDDLEARMQGAWAKYEALRPLAHPQDLAQAELLGDLDHRIIFTANRPLDAFSEPSAAVLEVEEAVAWMRAGPWGPEPRCTIAPAETTLRLIEERWATIDALAADGAWRRPPASDIYLRTAATLAENNGSIPLLRELLMAEWFVAQGTQAEFAFYTGQDLDDAIGAVQASPLWQRHLFYAHAVGGVLDPSPEALSYDSDRRQPHSSEKMQTWLSMDHHVDAISCS